MKYLLLLLLLTTSCITPRIEERCLSANLKIDYLEIEDTINGNSHASVSCSSKDGGFYD